jgi:hypothetical protein
VVVARLVLGHGAQETAERRGPNLHAVEVVLKPRQGFHEIADDLILGVLDAAGRNPIAICGLSLSQDRSLSVLKGLNAACRSCSITASIAAMSERAVRRTVPA